jgi:hypothetical protein
MRFEAEANLWAARTYGVFKGLLKIVDFFFFSRMENRPNGESLTENLPGLDAMRLADAQTGRPYS